MSIADDTNDHDHESSGRFQTTHWSAVRDASHEDSDQAHAALTRLCQTYWQPLYTFILQRGHKSEDAQDLVQGFFEQVLENGYFKGADQTKGTFRSYLLTVLKRYLNNE